MAEWATSGVRVSSADHSAEELTSLLGRQPTKTFDRNTLAIPGNPRSARRVESLWQLRSDLSEDAPIEEHLEWALNVIETLREPLATLPPGSADIFIGWGPPHGQASLELDHALLERLAAMPVDLIFDLYSLEGEAD